MKLLDRIKDQKIYTAVTAPPTPIGETYRNPFTGETFRITRHRPNRGHPWGGVDHYGVPVKGE